MRSFSMMMAIMERVVAKQLIWFNRNCSSLTTLGSSLKLQMLEQKPMATGPQTCYTHSHGAYLEAGRSWVRNHLQSEDWAI